MRAGRLRHRVQIQSGTETADAVGQPVTTWATTRTVWAAIEPLTGREFQEAQRTDSDITHTVTIRGNIAADVEKRLLFGTRVLNIESVLDKDERGITKQLMCKEDV